MDGKLSIDADRFLNQHIRSIAQLELLLLLRTIPDRWWSSIDVARELRVEVPWAQGELLNWQRQGLLTEFTDVGGQYRYQPQSPELERAVAEIAQAYLLNRVKVIEMIYRQSSPHIRALADAFRLRKDDNHG